MDYIRKAAFSRIIPNDGQLMGEVKVWPVKEEAPLLAWFAMGEDGCLQLKKLIRKQEELDLDWYGNDLHTAFHDVTTDWFSDPAFNGGCNRTEFEREILDYGDVAAAMEQRLWEAEQDLAQGPAFSPFVRHHAGGREDTGADV